MRIVQIDQGDMRPNGPARDRKEKHKMKTAEYTIITETATCYDAQGQITQTGVQVCDHGDRISIGATSHRKDELEIKSNEITSVNGWSLNW